VLPERPHPRSPLSPYTTLFRSIPSPTRRTGSKRSGRTRNEPRRTRGTRRRRRLDSRPVTLPQVTTVLPRPPAPPGRPREAPRLRSEEHTSELQSRENIVCRLLL